MTEQTRPEAHDERDSQHPSDHDREPRTTSRGREHSLDRSEHPVRHLAITSAVLAALTLGTFVAVTRFGFFSESDPYPFALVTLALWTLFFIACALLRGVRGRAVFVLVLVGTAAIGGVSLAGPPNTSTDSARYAWDGIVQSSGISPYAHVPADDALASLRPEWLFPAPGFDANGVPGCGGSRIDSTNVVGGDSALLCTAINRPQVPTIYPPLAELYFVAVRAPLPHDVAYWPFQVAGFLLVLATTGILLVALRRRRGDARWAALFGWCPLVATEAITNSHVDMLPALLALVATLLVSRGRALAGGIALGASIAGKLIPVIALPALVQRRPARVILAALATVVVLYVPYVLLGGAQVIGYLPGYLSEEGYEDGSRFALLSAFLPGFLATPIAAILLVALAFLVWRLTDPDRPWLGQLAMIGGVLAILTPHYPWYGLLLVPFVALSGRWEWLLVPLALTIGLVVPSVEILRLSMLVAIVVIGVISARRQGPGALEAARAGLRQSVRFRRMSPVQQSD